MMRLPLILWWSVIIGWLVAQRVGAQPGQGAADLNWPRFAKGYGLDLERARKDASREAAQKIATVMHDVQPSLRGWMPPTSYVERNLLENPALPGQDAEGTEQVKGKYWLFPIKTPSLDDLTALARRDQRNLRADARLGWAFQVFLALGAGLAIWAGYLRLDFWTAGRYTPWLRVGAMLIAALAITGIWWIVEFLRF